MPQSRLSVRKIRKVLRLRATGLSTRQIAIVVSTAISTVGECLCCAEAAGVAWPLSADRADDALEARLVSAAGATCHQRPPPDFGLIQAELRRKGVPLLSVAGWTGQPSVDSQLPLSAKRLSNSTGDTPPAEPCRRIGL